MQVMEEADACLQMSFFGGGWAKRRQASSGCLPAVLILAGGRTTAEGFGCPASAEDTD